MAPPAAVLVVEDETQVRELVSDALRREGYSVRDAADGSTANIVLVFAEQRHASRPEIRGVDGRG